MAITHLLVVRVVLLGVGEQFAQVVDRALDGLDLALLWSLDHQHRADRPRGRGYVEQLLVSECGSEVNPEKIKAIERMRKPARLRDV